MTRVVAVVLLAFVVVTCGDHVNVEKRVPPIGPYAPGLDLLGAGGLGDLQGDALKALIKSVLQVIKQLRITLENLKLCPNKKGDHKDNDYGHFEHGNNPGYGPDYEPVYEPPSYEHGHQPNYEADYHPDYVPSGQYKRDAGLSKVDLACDLLQPIIKAIIKLLKQLEKLLGCMMDKGKDYKGDYQDCKDEYNKEYPHDHKSGY